jgi:hypothetical protein
LTPGQGPEGINITNAGGQPIITLPGGGQIVATPIGTADGTSYQAALPSGDVLTINPDGSTSVQLTNGDTQNWDPNGHFTGTTPGDPNGAGLNSPTLDHDTIVPMNGGGYRVDHPDGSSDIYWPDGSVVHVNPDGVTWYQVSSPTRP